MSTDPIPATTGSASSLTGTARTANEIAADIASAKTRTKTALDEAVRRSGEAAAQARTLRAELDRLERLERATRPRGGGK